MYFSYIRPYLLSNEVDNYLDNYFNYYNENDNFTVLNKKDTHTIYGVALPGLKKEDLVVELMNNYLYVHGTTKDEYGNQVSYSKARNVHPSINMNDIYAKYENGYLTLTIPNKGSNVEQKQLVNIN